MEVRSAPLDLGTKSKAVLFFFASWHDGCGALETILSALSGTAFDEDNLFFGKVDAEEVSELTEEFQVTSVPTILLLNNSTTVVERLEGGVEPAQVTMAVQRLISASSSSSSGVAATTTPGNSNADGSQETTVSATTTIDPEKALNERLDRLIRGDAVMLFMKGVPTAPRCGFSRQAVELLQGNDIPFSSFDILQDNDVRQGLKKYSDWPTYPQIYVNGELVGGLDIMKELAEEDGGLRGQWEISDTISASAPVNSLDDRLKKLVNRHNVMVFMKGLPSAPRCGFSRQIIELLDEAGVSYDSFNILDDDEVRQGLKKFSNWPTYPQLYVQGDLVGGLDICQELKESGELLEMLQQ